MQYIVSQIALQARGALLASLAGDTSIETGLPEMMVRVKHNEMSLISIMQLSPYSSNPNEIPIQSSKFTTPVIVFDTESNNDQWHTILQL